MIEQQVWYTDLDGKECVISAHYNKSYRTYIASFTMDEIKHMLKNLGIRYKFKIEK